MDLFSRQLFPQNCIFVPYIFPILYYTYVLLSIKNTTIYGAYTVYVASNVPKYRREIAIL